MELNKFGSGKTLELNVLFSHKSIDHNIDISEAMMKFNLTAMSREQATEIQARSANNKDQPKKDQLKEETETIASDDSEEVPDRAGERAKRSLTKKTRTPRKELRCFTSYVRKKLRYLLHFITVVGFDRCSTMASIVLNCRAHLEL